VGYGKRGEVQTLNGWLPDSPHKGRMTMRVCTGRFIRIFCAGLACLLACAGLSPSRAESAHTPFTQASFSRTVDAEGLSAMVASGKGAVVAVNIFASWCPPCRMEVPDLIKARNDFPLKDFVLIGVSVDKEPKALVHFLNLLKVNYPVVLARENFIAEMKVTTVPRLLLYNKSGELMIDHRGRIDEKDLIDAVKHFLEEKQ
jgi:thiol-disulfide isomerase/thioredoxin